VSSLLKTGWCLLSLLAVLGAGCDPPGRPRPGDRPIPEDQVTDFDTLYRTRCAGCHGAAGKFGPAPPLNDALFLAIVPDDELLRVIREGRAVSPAQKTPMPAFARERGGPLTAQQVEALAKGIKARWGGEAPKDAPPPYLAPKKTGDKERGAKLFDLACVGCHGNKGRGAEQAGAVNDRAFLALISDQELRRIIITGRADLGMPDYSSADWRSPKFETLTSEQINDLVALLASWRHGGSANDTGGTER
jgi:mono/diheme cytochrome c family protein